MDEGVRAGVTKGLGEFATRIEGKPLDAETMAALEKECIELAGRTANEDYILLKGGSLAENEAENLVTVADSAKRLVAEGIQRLKASVPHAGASATQLQKLEAVTVELRKLQRSVWWPLDKTDQVVETYARGYFLSCRLQNSTWFFDSKSVCRMSREESW